MSLSRYDYGKLSQLVHTLQLLSVAYACSREGRYAERAALLLSVWFVQPDTRMNPHLNFAQTIPGREGVAGPPTYPPRWVEGRPGHGLFVSSGGAIEGACFTLLLDALRPFQDSPAFSAALWDALRAWFSDFLDWLLTSPLGQDEKNTRNNHALWYRVQVASYALFTGRHNLARSIIETDLPALLDAHLLEQPPRDGGHEDKARVEALCRMLMAAAATRCDDPLFSQVLDRLPPWPADDERALLFPNR